MINGKKQTIREYVDDNIGSVEGTAVKSTGEDGGTKFLREDGDGTCSWQTPSGSSATVATGSEVDTGTDNTKMVTPKAMEDSSYAKTTALHTQGTDQGLDTGGANAVTAAQAKTAYDYSQVGHLTKPLIGVDGTSTLTDGDMIYVYKADTEDWRLIGYLDLLGTIQRDLGL